MENQENNNPNQGNGQNQGNNNQIQSNGVNSNINNQGPITPQTGNGGQGGQQYNNYTQNLNNQNTKKKSKAPIIIIIVVIVVLLFGCIISGIVFMGIKLFKNVNNANTIMIAAIKISLSPPILFKMLFFSFLVSILLICFLPHHSQA